MEDGILTSEAGSDGQRILAINSMISSWRGAKSRVMYNKMHFTFGLACSYCIIFTIRDQFVLWSAENDWDGIILPQIMPAGTATRRAVEKTWLTASNAKV